LSPQLLAQFGEAKRIKVESINPFIESVFELLSTMLGCEVKHGEVALAKHTGTAQELTALIGLSGRARGNVAISFSEDTAMAMLSRLHGADVGAAEETIIDVLVEIVNMVGGGAKARFRAETPVDLSLPGVVRGMDYSVKFPSSSDWPDIPFTSELGPFNLRVGYPESRIIVLPFFAQPLKRLLSVTLETISIGKHPPSNISRRNSI
jgi:chemotaxis protein CheX